MPSTDVEIELKLFDSAFVVSAGFVLKVSMEETSLPAIIVSPLSRLDTSPKSVMVPDWHCLMALTGHWFTLPLPQMLLGISL